MDKFVTRRDGFFWRRGEGGYKVLCEGGREGYEINVLTNCKKLGWIPAFVLGEFS